MKDLCLLVERRIGLDIGGTLAKLAYVKPLAERKDDDGCDSVTRPIRFKYEGLKYICQFRFFPTDHPDQLTDFIKGEGLVNRGDTLRVSGGGAHKFEAYLASELGVAIVKCDEMKSLMTGLTFASGFKGSAFSYDLRSKMKREEPVVEDPYPFLVVNIGSGVSILKGLSSKEFVRVSGTCIGGGTVLGLSKLVCGADSYDEVVALSERGTDVLDLTVRDLVGDTAGSRTLPPDALASSFGRIYVENSPTHSALEVYKEDVARSAIKMVSYNLGYLAFLLAEIHQVKHIYFTGKYISNHAFIMKTITQAVVFYSLYSRDMRTLQSASEFEGMEPPHSTSFENLVSELQRRSDYPNHKALFLQHDGYMGALGVMLSPE